MRVRHALLLISTTIVAILLPWIMPGYLSYTICLTEANVLAIMGLNILMAYSGQMSLGQAGFAAMGAYVTAISTAKLGLGFVPSVLLSMAISGIIGALIGLLVLRLQGPYLAVATLGFGAAVPEIIIQLTPITGGSQGMSIPLPNIFGFVVNNYVEFYYVILIILVFAFWGTANLLRSRFGREMKSVMDDEPVSRAYGLNVTYYRVVAFILASVLTGLSGSLQGYVIQYVSPDDFSFWTSIFYVAAVVIGGMGWRYGPIIGGVFITIVPQLTANMRGLNSIIIGTCLLAILLLVHRRNLTYSMFFSRLIHSGKHTLVGRLGRYYGGTTNH